MGTMAEMLSTPLGVIEWFVYLLAAVMFVIGLHLMNSPKTARKGNMVSAVGMILAVVMAFIVLFAGEISNGFQHGVAVVLLIAGIIIGAVAMRFGNRKLRQQQALQFELEKNKAELDDRHAAARFRIQHRGWRRRRACGFERHSDLRGHAFHRGVDHRWFGHHDRFRHVLRLSDRSRQAAGHQVGEEAELAGASGTFCSPY